MTCAGRACPGWPGWALRRTWQTNSQSSGRRDLRGCSRVSTARFPFGASTSPRPVGRPYRKDSQRRSPRAPKRTENRRMSAVLPNGYLTILEAADLLSRAMYAGVRDLPVVSRLRKEGLNVRDGQARYRAIAEIWKAVDEDRLRAVAIGGRPRRILRLDPELTKSITGLRSPCGRGFTWLRQSNPAYHQFGRRLTRARRIAQKAEGPKNPRGRPSRMATVQPGDQ
jgi:hypothetical protein